MPLDGLCDLAELPATTPAELQVLESTSKAELTALSGKAFANTGRNKRIYMAATKLQFAATQAVVESKASGSQKELLSLVHSGVPDIIPSVSEGQAQLRAACND